MLYLINFIYQAKSDSSILVNTHNYSYVYIIISHHVFWLGAFEMTVYVHIVSRNPMVACQLMLANRPSLIICSVYRPPERDNIVNLCKAFESSV